ncbi:MAG TPA: helix-turn-helix domain-containing protein, partial [Chloroflexia bacterium]|nr:helix-turn-helix domain-containing protein [Chloroflexia bacterium]
MDAPTPAAAFAAWIKERRQALDLTQAALAQRAGCSVETIRKIEAGTRRPSPPVAQLLADCLEVAPDQRARFLQQARGGPAGPAAPPAGLPAAARAGRPLPVPLTALVGRAADLARARALLGRGGVRLLTLIGPGGVGKTRLALQLATDLQPDFADGAYFISLAAVHDPALVDTAIAAALGVQEVAHQPLAARLRSYLRDQAALLVLDNFEQVGPAAPLLVDLLEGAPHLRMVVTSRAVLQVRGERVLPVPPLAVPEPGDGSLADLAHSPAVALFLARALESQPALALTDAHLAAVGEICRRLEGLPLAIELAAARVALFSPPALLARLTRLAPAPALDLLTGGYRDLPARQQTLRATIAWSYALLDPAEQQWLRWLAIFEGGCTAAAAAAIAVGSDEGLGVG